MPSDAGSPAWAPPPEADQSTRSGTGNVVTALTSPSGPMVARAAHDRGDPYDPGVFPSAGLDVFRGSHGDASDEPHWTATPRQAGAYLVNGRRVDLQSYPNAPRHFREPPPEGPRPADDSWLLPALMSVAGRIRRSPKAWHRPKAQDAVNWQTDNIVGLTDPGLQVIPLVLDGAPTAENLRWAHRNWMADRVEERFGRQFLAALGIPDRTVLEAIVPRPVSYSPTDDMPVFEHGDLSRNNAVVVNRALAELLRPGVDPAAVLERYRELVLGTIGDRHLARTQALIDRLGAAGAAELLFWSGALHAATQSADEWRSERTPQEMLARVTRQAAEVVHGPVRNLPGRFTPALTLAEFDAETAMVRSHPLTGIGDIAYMRYDFALPDTWSKRSALESYCVGAVDLNLGLFTFNHLSMFDLARTVKLNPQWHPGRIVQAYGRRVGRVVPDELRAGLLEQYVRSLYCDLMRGSEGRVPMSVSVHAVHDLLAQPEVRAVLGPDFRPPTKERIGELLGDWVDRNGVQPAHKPWHLVSEERDSGDLRELPVTRAGIESARAANGGADPDAAQVAVHTVKVHVEAETARRARAMADTARAEQVEADAALERFRQCSAAVAAHENTRGIRPPPDVSVVELHAWQAVAERHSTPEHAALLWARTAAASDWETHQNSADIHTTAVQSITHPEVARAWLGTALPQNSGDLPNPASQVLDKVASGLANIRQVGQVGPVKEGAGDNVVWKVDTLSSAQRAQPERGVALGLGLESQRSW